jgi:hypothetical protein
MNDPITYQGNDATRGAAPVQFFEAAGELPPAGTKATPRPEDRPREVPLSGPPSAAFQLFASKGPSGAEWASATPRPAGRERAVTDLAPPPAAPSSPESGQRT